MAQQSATEGHHRGQRGRAVRRALFFLVASTLSGMLAVLGVEAMFDGYQRRIAEALEPEDTVMVAVAARDLYQGVTITEEDLYLVALPPRYVPQNVFFTPDHLLGRTPRERILANELVRGDRLADPESGTGLNAVIPRGMRAISIDLSDAPALQGLLNPGSYVDLMGTARPHHDSDRTVTRTALQAVFVLGVNSRTAAESAEEALSWRDAQRPSVTLLVNAHDAEVVANAQALGQVTLTLRANDDLAWSETHGVDARALRSQLESEPSVAPRTPPAAEAAEDSGWWVKLIRGAEVTLLETTSDGAVIR